MATSPNFSWPEPDNTDLVKNGALAIRTAVDAIDASLLDLKGGTTNQVLAKNSNTDMDFKWVADASGIPATIFDAKGDLIAASAADTAARLAVGANNTVLTADSSTATGLKWATPSSGLTWTLLNAGGTALTGSATVTVSGISDKESLMVIISNGSSSSASANVKIRVNTDTATNYNAWGNQTNGASTYASTQFSSFSSTSGTGIQLVDMANNAASVTTGYVRLDGCKSTGIKAFWGAGGASIGGGSNQYNYTFGGYYNGSAAVTSISANVDAGNWDAGTMFIYGA
jgi:trimeric autotransporter adhesin